MVALLDLGDFSDFLDHSDLGDILFLDFNLSGIPAF